MWVWMTRQKPHTAHSTCTTVPYPTPIGGGLSLSVTVTIHIHGTALALTLYIFFFLFLVVASIADEVAVAFVVVAVILRIVNRFVSCTKFITNLFLFNFCYWLVRETRRRSPKEREWEREGEIFATVGQLHLPRPHFPLVTVTHSIIHPNSIFNSIDDELHRLRQIEPFKTQ